MRPEHENTMDDEPAGDEEKTEYEYSEEYDDSTSDADNQQRFILAPTPAQLGRAPLQRRLGSIVGGDANSKHTVLVLSIQFISWISFFFSQTYRSTADCKQRSHSAEHPANYSNANICTIRNDYTEFGRYGRYTTPEPIITDNAEENFEQKGKRRRFK